VKKQGSLSWLIMLITGSYFFFAGSCAQISNPTGGVKDSIPPRLVKASPDLRAVSVTGNRITLNFDEYIDVQEVQKNLLISPLQKQQPVITAGLRSINIRLRDTLLPNTTYSINFGDAIKDLNEGNILRNFTYVFSTGPTIDSLTLSGKVIMAENGKTDSTMIAMLYRDAPDSAVQKRKPDYIARLHTNGSFTFENLPAASFKLYALKDGDGGRTYNSLTEAFAFLDQPVNPATSPETQTLYAFTVDKQGTKTPPQKSPADKRLRITTNVVEGKLDQLGNLRLSINNPIAASSLDSIILLDTNLVKQPATLAFDSTRKQLEVTSSWKPGSAYILVIPKNSLRDSTGTTLLRNDSVRFVVRTNEEYGRLVLRFPNIDLKRKPVLQFVQNDLVIRSYPLASNEWRSQLFQPGEYEIRILYDTNGDGKWTPGDYASKRQPEIAVVLPQKLSIRADWDNERDISL
jgi:uncharacterized protein (DUF2141 family)